MNQLNKGDLPQGWKLVPVEPTLQMKLAVKKALGNHSTDGWWLEDFWEDQYGPAYAAMLTAAPEAPAQVSDAERLDWVGTLQSVLDELPYRHHLIPRITELLDAARKGEQP